MATTKQHSVTIRLNEKEYEALSEYVEAKESTASLEVTRAILSELDRFNAEKE